MRHVEVRYRNFEQKDTEDKVRAVIKKYSFLFPAWLRELNVNIVNNPDENGAHAWCTAEVGYSSASITFTPVILDRPLREMHKTFVHELVHLANARQWEFVRNRVLDLIPDGQAKEYILADHTERVEEFTVHMTQVIVDGYLHEPDAKQEEVPS